MTAHTPKKKPDNCGCWVAADDEPEFFYCPLHAAAPELLEALEHFARVDLRGDGPDEHGHLIYLIRGMQVAAKRVLAKAKGAR